MEATGTNFGLNVRAAPTPTATGMMKAMAKVGIRATAAAAGPGKKNGGAPLREWCPL